MPPSPALADVFYRLAESLTKISVGHSMEKMKASYINDIVFREKTLPLAASRVPAIDSAPPISSIGQCMPGVFGSCNPFKVLVIIILLIAVFVIYEGPTCVTPFNKGFCNKAMNIPAQVAVSDRKRNNSVTIYRIEIEGLGLPRGRCELFVGLYKPGIANAVAVEPSNFSISHRIIMTSGTNSQGG